ncbi:putative ATP-dependent kinase TDA10 [Pseudozyma hubeiensis]|nr:putative ATP-dependent kinase TDA10 [Pseudozyma hubeiensis]
MASVSAAKTPLRAVDVFGQHVVQQLKSFRSRFASNNAIPPLFVAMQGPQGSGKTTVTRSLVQHLRSTGLTVGVLSTDDLYHTHQNLRRVAEENRTNPLLSGRGQPGTHDVELGKQILDQIYAINDPSVTGGKEAVRLPVFDKSLFNGEGDRAPYSDASPTLNPPLDVFILEGWSMGFSSIPPPEVEAKQKASHTESPLRRYALDALQQINRNLEAYTAWYTHFSIFLQIKPTNLDNVYTWRTQQEHAMKASNGGIGMSDDGVKAFVDRYMPGYHLFLDTIQQNDQWKGRSKTITIDLDRTIVDVHDW